MEMSCISMTGSVPAATGVAARAAGVTSIWVMVPLRAAHCSHRRPAPGTPGARPMTDRTGPTAVRTSSPERRGVDSVLPVRQRLGGLLLGEGGLLDEDPGL